MRPTKYLVERGESRTMAMVRARTHGAQVFRIIKHDFPNGVGEIALIAYDRPVQTTTIVLVIGQTGGIEHRLGTVFVIDGHYYFGLGWVQVQSAQFVLARPLHRVIQTFPFHTGTIPLIGQQKASAGTVETSFTIVRARGDPMAGSTTIGRTVAPGATQGDRRIIFEPRDVVAARRKSGVGRRGGGSFQLLQLSPLVFQPK
jgi:hypothetical protein